MKLSKQTSALPFCPLAHSLLDKLTTIVDHCEIPIATSLLDSVSSKRLTLVRQAALSMAAQLKDYHCDQIALRKHGEKGSRQPIGLTERVERGS